MISPLDRLTAALADRYRLERELGAGGMATVYLARDIKHDRDVAIKVLKPELAAVLGADRFVVEIKTTASMSHPHILPLFDSGEADGFLFYVMPFIEGETLRDMLNRETQCSVETAVRLTREIADALDYAHRRGVIHRDIKPENILLHDGRAMVMDFGIALAVSAAAGGRMTETGLSLGTPHYMSPEQATADRTITARSDVYSLGSVLYEMLTGDPPHTGSSAQQIIMKIITEPAEPVTKYRKTVPQNVAAAVARSLEKLPADRFDSAKALADALLDVHFTSVSLGSASPMASGRSGRPWLRDPRSIGALAMMATLAVVAGVAAMRDRVASSPPRIERVSIVGPPDSEIVSFTNARSTDESSLTSPTVSADGRQLLFTVTRPKGAELVLRSLDRPDMRVVADSGVNGAFFAPDSRRFGFLVGSDLFKADVVDAKPTLLARIPEAYQEIYFADWHPDGRIFLVGKRGLWTVPDAGGDATLLVEVSGPDRVLRRAQVLADGRLLLSYASPKGPANEIRRADGTKPERVLEGQRVAAIIDDILLFGPANALKATRVNASALTPMGPVVSVGDLSARLGRSIAKADPAAASLQPILRSNDGVETPLPVPPSVGGGYRWPKLSPDGRLLALGTPKGVRVFDLARRLSWPMGGSTEPVWTADGATVIMSRGERPIGGLLKQTADGSRAPDTLLTLRDGDAWPTSVSPDGAWLAYYGVADTKTVNESDGDMDLFFMDLRSRASRRLALPGIQSAARFSPDGRWVAYSTFESGSPQVQLRDWPALASRYIVSNDGGLEPTWSPDGHTLYYRRRGDVMAVSLTESGGQPVLSTPRVLFTGTYRQDPSGDQSYDVRPDGRFLFVKSLRSDRVIIDVTLDWIEEIRAQLQAASAK